jgi:hypothetical protein
MANDHKKARIAGILYLILVITGILNLLYIPSLLIVWEDPALTLENIINSEGLFRLGIVIGIISFLAFLLLPLALYSLLVQVNKTQAVLMVLFAVVSIPISFMNMLRKFTVLTLIGRPPYLQDMNTPELQSQVMFHLDAYNNGIELSQVFWGLWLLPFGYLVFKSGFLPKFLGIFLMLGCFGYLIEFLADFLYPGYSGTLLQTLVGIPSSIGELGICLWLLIAGARTIRIKGKSI